MHVVPPADFEPALAKDRERRRRVFYPKTDHPLADAELRRLRHASDEELGITPAAVVHAAARALSIPDLRLERLTDQGTFHRLYRVHAGDRRFILRIAVPTGAEPDFGLTAEGYLAPRLAARDVPICATHWVDLSRSEVPFDYAVLDEVQGTSMRTLDADETATRAALVRLGRLVAALHQVPATAAGLLDVGALSGGRLAGVCDAWQVFFFAHLDDHLARIAGTIHAGDAPLDRIAELLEAARPHLRDAQSALLHGDLGSHNISLAADGTISAVIDWEDALAGDPAYDVAFWATFHPARRHDAFLAGYREACGIADADDFAVRFWASFLRVAVAKAAWRARFDLTDLPGREPAWRRLLAGLDGLRAALDGRALLSPRTEATA